MKIMDAIVLLLAVVMLTGCATYCARRTSYDTASKEQEREVVLNRIIIPAICVSNAPVTDVIAQLVKLSTIYDPEHAGCSIIFNTAPPPDQQEGKTEEEICRISDEPAKRRVTLDLGKTTFLTAVDALCQEAGLVWSLETVVIVTTPDNYKFWKQTSNVQC